ncbi:hypothetical protein BKA58DRAFT_371299 [Alternaria rosae]|uniref:uncharacterized protein n=1 Tax=Alternaria rosae TaxID=1187941 RepID=UPI001E8E466B|nr:uncharacterized protein BKA58DRAFT_371299 [Alternaria rosae]KAH6881278.1 hypothetical protein BKA58DRAFT_371299 [Alternaria rosae]
MLSRRRCAAFLPLSGCLERAGLITIVGLERDYHLDDGNSCNLNVPRARAVSPAGQETCGVEMGIFQLYRRSRDDTNDRDFQRSSRIMHVLWSQATSRADRSEGY